MKPFAAADNGIARPWQRRDAAGWLALAASPTLALIAWIEAGSAPMAASCASASGILPIDGMTAMYLLMALFHLAPWLKLAAGRAWPRP